ncbi:MAG TPA: lipid II flippase MurJ [Terracidiphilus sp.]|nr:lipid II flippase MurJ [Terracidiphilus sp.]
MKRFAIKPGADRRIFRSAVVVSLCLVLVKIAGVAKEFVVAGIFGRSDELEAFFIAALIPGLLINIVSESLNQALIPTIVRVREQAGREEARKLFSNAMLWNAGLLLGVGMAMATSARAVFPLLGSHFTEEKLGLAINMFYGMQPVVVLTGIASMCAAVLNTEGEFAVPAIAPIVTSISVILMVPLLVKRTGAWSLVYAMLAGALVHVFWMMWKTSRSGCLGWPKLHGMDENAREVIRQSGPLILSGVVASGGLLIDQAMAASLPAGSLAALAYAGRFISVALALLGGAISSALTPILSEMVARKEWGECKRTVRRWAERSMTAAMVTTGALMFGSRMLVRLTLQHGAFGAKDSAVVSGVLVMYALQIPFFVSSRVFYRVLVAMRRTDIVLYCGVLNLGLDVVLNVVLMRWMGVAGIALATSLWTISTFLFLWYWSKRVLAVVESACAVTAAD